MAAKRLEPLAAYRLRALQAEVNLARREVEHAQREVAHAQAALNAAHAEYGVGLGVGVITDDGPNLGVMLAPDGKPIEEAP